MKFDVTFTVKGPDGVAEVPNSKNPVEADDLAQVLERLGGFLAGQALGSLLAGSMTLGLEYVGLTIRPADDRRRCGDVQDDGLTAGQTGRISSKTLPPV